MIRIPSPAVDWDVDGNTEGNTGDFQSSETGFADFVFEEVAQWLDDLFEIYIVRKSSYIVVGFDDCRLTCLHPLSTTSG